VDATDEALATSFRALFPAIFIGLSRGFSLEGGGADQLDDEYGAATRLVSVVDERGCIEKFFPVEIFVLVLARRPCTSLSAVQARWKKRVMLVYSL
jgi:hypothetical protein